MIIARGPMDQRKIESRRDVVLFATDVLKKPLELTGRISARLYVTSDCPDTDFTVKLSDVYPDGRSMIVTDGILRARFRRSFEREDFLEPGKIYELAIELSSTSLIFKSLKSCAKRSRNVSQASVDHCTQKETTQAKTGALNRKISARLLQSSQDQTRVMDPFSLWVNQFQ